MRYESFKLFFMGFCLSSILHCSRTNWNKSEPALTKHYEKIVLEPTLLWRPIKFLGKQKDEKGPNVEIVPAEGDYYGIIGQQYILNATWILKLSPKS